MSMHIQNLYKPSFIQNFFSINSIQNLLWVNFITQQHILGFVISFYNYTS
jgi:hypothetical protein